MTELRKIEGRVYDDPRQPLPPLSPGEKPQLRWIAVDLLRVDTLYQRSVNERGARNIRRIAREFNWSMFGTVIVSETDAGIYLIIDGQHRTLAASLRGVKDVPCQIVKIDTANQARAFAAINGGVTAITPMQLYHAKAGKGEMSFYVKGWLKLPLVLRQRWWDETDYGRKAPSDELVRAMKEANHDCVVKEEPAP